MEILGGLESVAGRVLGGSLGPVSRRLLHHHHARTLARGDVEKARRQSAHAQWWGSDPHWYPGGRPPRMHNRVTPLIDGFTYLAALHTELDKAHAYVYIIGWCLTPYTPLERDPERDLVDTQLLPVLLETARRVPVRILLWAGAPALVQPTARAASAVQRVIEEAAAREGVDLRCVLDKSAHLSHCHHQKAVVIDGQTAFVGGMDLTTFQGDRWDEFTHPLRGGPNWHDVQVKIEGEAVADVEFNFRQRWSAEDHDAGLPHRDPVVDPAWQTPVQIVRTIPAHTYAFAPRGEYGIHHAYLELIRGAQRLIYLENQYLWSPEIVDALIEAMNKPHHGPFRIVIVLPALAYSGKWDNDKHVTALRKADGDRGMFEAYSIYASGPHAGVSPFRYRPIYVHAKVMIVDDEWFSVGSANLNTRGVVTDSELNALVHDPGIARDLRAHLWAEHLAVSPEAVAEADPVEQIDGEWKRQASKNAEIVQGGIRPLISNVHRYETGRMPGFWLLDEVEALTFEH
ncbi:MAG: phospholipase D-like domain-containing protein [Thermomicrobiales bacterium]